MLGTAGLDHRGHTKQMPRGVIRGLARSPAPFRYRTEPHVLSNKEILEYTVKLGCLISFCLSGGLFDDTTLFTDGLTVSVLSTG